ncbi:glycoside hydrolase family 13 protein, partial [Enterococcus mundtii]|uniref:glycoside hydrolase family 13 protein n=2 Tax=Enterococcus TaxID=1350 RepID=UPI00035E0FC1
MKQSEKWWKEAVGYQIYPASFKDSNNDGIGDINGIREKLSYLKELGIDFIWINPIYQSPFVDNGYDISDYQAILEKFGTMDEFDALLAEAHQMGIKIIMDLVINHSSDQHEWFIESRQSVDNPYRDYYIWVDGTPDQAPNEWQSIFGGSAWQYDEQTGQYYLHIFAKEQPDLNWESDKLKAELFTMIRWWLDKGIDGFRLDAISHVKKDEYSVQATENPFSPFQNVSGIEDHLTELKNVFDEYDIMTVGEASGVSANEGPEWVGENGYFDMIFEFDHISIWKHEKDGDLDVLSLKQSLSAWQRALDGKGWNALYMENHDVPRCVSVFGDTSPAYWQVSAKAIAMMYFFLQGTPFIYQGQEIGMTNLPFSSIDEIDAVDSKRLYQQLLDEGRSEEEALDIVANTTRDNSRTPMQWNDHLYAGFSEVAPWLLVNPNYQMINVANQTNDPESILSFYKKMITLRRENKGLIYGSFNEYLPDNEQLFVYERVLDEERYLIIVNLTDEAATYTLPTEIETNWEVL